MEVLETELLLPMAESSPPSPAHSLFALGGRDSPATTCFHRSQKGLDRGLGDLEKGPSLSHQNALANNSSQNPRRW